MPERTVPRTHEQVLTLSEAASQMGWSRRTLVRSLARHGIPTIGTGRRARLELKDLEMLKAKERSGVSLTPPEEPRSGLQSMRATWPVGPAMDTLDKNYWRRVMGQRNRRSPVEKATSPLRLILFLTDLDETTRGLEMLQRALDEAMPIVRDENLKEEQKRVNLRKTLKAATSAIWVSHQSGGNRRH